MALSSSTLFNFTDRIEVLISILTHEFRAHYALEDFSDIFGQPENNDKMFLDIKLLRM